MSANWTHTTAMWMPPVLMWSVALIAHATLDLKEMESTAQVRTSVAFLSKGENFHLLSDVMITIYMGWQLILMVMYHVLPDEIDLYMQILMSALEGPMSVTWMESAQTTSEVMTVTAALDILEMGSCVMISMNAMRPIHCTTVTLMLTVPTQREASCVHVMLDTLGMVSAAVSSSFKLQN